MERQTSVQRHIISRVSSFDRQWPVCLRAERNDKRLSRIKQLREWRWMNLHNTHACYVTMNGRTNTLHWNWGRCWGKRRTWLLVLTEFTDPLLSTALQLACNPSETLFPDILAILDRSTEELGRIDDSSTGRILDISSTSLERSSGLAWPLGSMLTGRDVRAVGKLEVLLLPTLGRRDVLSVMCVSDDATLLARV